jgi:hypothetical protein
MKQILRTASKAPRARPGKKPARIAPAGNFWQVVVMGVTLALAPAPTPTVAELVEEEVGEAAVDADCELAGEMVGVEVAVVNKLVWLGDVPWSGLMAQAPALVQL